MQIANEQFREPSTAILRDVFSRCEKIAAANQAWIIPQKKAILSSESPRRYQNQTMKYRVSRTHLSLPPQPSFKYTFMRHFYAVTFPQLVSLLKESFLFSKFLFLMLQISLNESFTFQNRFSRYIFILDIVIFSIFNCNLTRDFQHLPSQLILLASSFDSKPKFHNSKLTLTHRN